MRMLAFYCVLGFPSFVFRLSLPPTLPSFLYKIFATFVLECVYACVCVGMHVPWHTGGSQRDNSLLPPNSGCQAWRQALYLPSHLHGPSSFLLQCWGPKACGANPVP